MTFGGLYGSKNLWEDLLFYPHAVIRELLRFLCSFMFRTRTRIRMCRGWWNGLQRNFMVLKDKEYVHSCMHEHICAVAWGCCSGQLCGRKQCHLCKARYCHCNSHGTSKVLSKWQWKAQCRHYTSEAFIYNDLMGLFSSKHPSTTDMKNTVISTCVRTGYVCTRYAHLCALVFDSAKPC